MDLSAVSTITYISHLRAVVYELPAITIQDTVPAEVVELADRLFERLMLTSNYRSNGEGTKRKYWHELVHAGIQAVHVGGCVRYSRGNKNCSKSLKRLVRCAKQAGFFHEVRSTRTNREGAKQSRLVPAAEFYRLVPSDPWHLGRPTTTQYVRMRGREDKQPLSLAPVHVDAIEAQQKLELVNTINSDFMITYRPEHDLYAVQMRPIQWALYHEHWWHGRIYIERNGNGASLTKKERSTIRFDGEPSVELDFSATHPRLAYHLRGLQYQGDPYCLWGDGTTTAKRQLAKLVINTALNAKSRRDAIGACFQAIRLKTTGDTWKEGNTLERAKELRKAVGEIISPQTATFYMQTRRLIADIYDLAMEQHKLIAADFGDDAGASLMGIESRIALDVLFYFAGKGIPVLGVHDSFVVPESHREELRLVMTESYRQRLGIAPVVK